MDGVTRGECRHRSPTDVVPPPRAMSNPNRRPRLPSTGRLGRLTPSPFKCSTLVLPTLGLSAVVTIQATTAATFWVVIKTLCRTALRKTVFGGEAHKLHQSKSARANYGRHLRSRSLVDCAKPQPWRFARHPPLHLHCQGCEPRRSGACCGIVRTGPRKSWDRTQRTVSLHCVSWMTLLSAAGVHLGATRTEFRCEFDLCCFIWSEVPPAF